eukprot:TRINITY_DN6797_c0_g1_i1.p1 TRINITY_DN6797_c0_g1~~TRINITY_DN6797_c0_g1_i1.p1  ORF type:complete len:1024 (+),score=319.29 TRINITY_DN6797_c0_g1_i1:58-3129(+)
MESKKKYKYQPVDRTKRTILQRWRALQALAWNFVKHTGKQIRRSKLNFCVGFIACMLVVMVTSVLLTVLGTTPVVFLRLAELQNGEYDMTITIDGPNQMNYTLISQVLEEASKIAAKDGHEYETSGEAFTYHSPRMSVSARLIPPVMCSQGGDGVWECNEDSSQRGYMYLIDSDRERRMGCGRDWTLPKLEKGEIHISATLASQLRLKAGDEIFIGMALRNLFGQFWDENLGGSPWTATYYKLKIRGIFDSPGGKFPSSWNRGMLMEIGSFLEWLSEQKISGMNEQDTLNLRQKNLYDYVDFAILNLPPQERLEMYIDQNFDNVQEKVTSFSSEIIYHLGFTVANTDLPILRTYSPFQYLNLFLGLVINVVIFILLFICVILIYSLLVTNVETRTFEIGVFRMFGMKRIQVILLLLLQALSYIAFSYPMGLAVGQLLCWWVFSAIELLISVEIPKTLTPMATFVAGVMGILIPTISSILPIRNALGWNLADSLDVRASKVSAVKIDIDRSETSTVSVNVILMGVMTTGFGVGVYYLLPYALLSFNLGLLLNLFVVLLIGLLLGTTMLAINFQNILEKILIYSLLWWERAAIRDLVGKNMIAHRMRNRKTTMLYAVSLAFIVFVQVSYSLQMESFLYQLQQRNGAYLKVTGNGWDPISQDAAPIPRDIVTRLENFAATSPMIKNSAWISRDLLEISDNFTSLSISNVGRMTSYSCHVYAVSPQLFSATIGFLDVEEFSGNFSLLESLYTSQGSHGFIVGTLFSKNLKAEPGDHVLLTVGRSQGLSPIIRRMTPVGVVNTAPAFTFSPYPSVRTQDILVSFPTFLRMSDGLITSVEDIPLRDFLLMIDPSISDSELETLKRTVENLLDGSSGISIWDYRDQIKPISKANEILAYFFNFTTAVALAVCWFSLNSSMFANVYEQTREISVLRAIGVTKFWMFRIYVYEALILVLSSSLLGAFIGSLVGYTMVIQRALYTQLPIPFVFPTQIMSVVGGSSIVFAVLASLGPVYYLLRLPIVSLMRYTS